MRPLPLSMGTLDRFSLSEETDETGEGEGNCWLILFRFWVLEGGGDAPYRSSSKLGAGDWDILDERDILRQRKDAFRVGFVEV